MPPKRKLPTPEIPNTQSSSSTLPQTSQLPVDPSSISTNTASTDSNSTPQQMSTSQHQTSISPSPPVPQSISPPPNVTSSPIKSPPVPLPAYNKPALPSAPAPAPPPSLQQQAQIPPILSRLNYLNSLSQPHAITTTLEIHSLRLSLSTLGYSPLPPPLVSGAQQFAKFSSEIGVLRNRIAELKNQGGQDGEVTRLEGYVKVLEQGLSDFMSSQRGLNIGTSLTAGGSSVNSSFGLQLQTPHQLSGLPQQQRSLQPQTPVAATNLPRPFPSSSYPQTSTALRPTAPLTQQALSRTPIPPPEGTRLVDRAVLRGLLEGVSPGEKMEGEVEDLLLDLSDSFVAQVLDNASQLAKFRKSTTLGINDVTFFLERNWGLKIPGYGRDEVKVVPERKKSRKE